MNRDYKIVKVFCSRFDYYEYYELEVLPNGWRKLQYPRTGGIFYENPNVLVAWATEEEYLQQKRKLIINTL